MNLDILDSIAKRYIEDDFFSGVACQITVDGKEVLKKAYGQSNRNTKKDVNLQTVFDLASITKLFTTTIILKLITEKKVSLSTSLKECLPITKDSNVLSSLTIYELLTHTSGLIAWHPLYTHLPNRMLFEILSSLNLSGGKKGETLYSDLNFILLGEVIKYQTGNSLQLAVDNYLKKALKFKSLTYGPLIDTENIAATEFGNQIEKQMCADRNLTFSGWRDEVLPISGEVNDGNCHYFFDGQSGHAGLFSNLQDLISLGELYLKGGEFEGTQFIDRNLIELAIKPQYENRGLGWEMSQNFPIGFGHTGFTGTSLWVVPEIKMVVALLTNRLHVNSPKNIKPFRDQFFNEILVLLK